MVVRPVSGMGQEYGHFIVFGYSVSFFSLFGRKSECSVFLYQMNEKLAFSLHWTGSGKEKLNTMFIISLPSHLPVKGNRTLFNIVTP